VLLAELLAIHPDLLGAAIRDRTAGMLFAPRPPFYVGAVVADDAPERFAIVSGPLTHRGYRWLGDAVVDDRGATIAAISATGRASIDARLLVDAALADATAGAWLVAHGPNVPKDARYLRLVPGCTIGRSQQAHLVLATSTVARQHCRFEYDGTRWAVEDLRSTNGTYIGQQRIDRAVLEDRQVIHVAGTEVEFRATMMPKRRPVLGAQTSAWAALFLTRIQLGNVVGQPVYERDTPCALPAKAATLRWLLDGGDEARDARWLLQSIDDANVWFDVLVAREGDELASPLVCDDCACFAARDRTIVVARIEQMVARVDVRAPDPDTGDRATHAAEIATYVAMRAGSM
jgi:hypothetical protein